MFKCSFISRSAEFFCRNLHQDFSKIVYFAWQSTIRHSQILSWLKTINFPYTCHELIFSSYINSVSFINTTGSFTLKN